MNKIEIDKDELKNLLEKFSISQVSVQLGVGKNTIIRRAKEHCLPISKIKPHLRNIPEFTEDQENLLKGTLLGDGMITYIKNKSSCFRFGQKSDRFEYVNYLNNIM